MKSSPSSRSPKGGGARDEQKESWLPFGYHLQRDADLLIVRRSDGSFVAAFNVGVDPFEVEWAVWEDAD
jgi:hypothetical protein